MHMDEKHPGNIYGRRLREARNSYGYSLTELGIAVGLDRFSASGRISRYENGIHQPKQGLQNLFADALALPVAYFYTEDDAAARQIADASRSDKPVQKLIEVRKARKRK